MPEGIQKLAHDRTSEMVSFYGLNIRSVTLDQLAQSCYLQGIEDAMEVAVKEAISLADPQPVLNYEI